MRVLWRNNRKIVIRSTDSFVRFLYFSAWQVSNILNTTELRYKMVCEIVLFQHEFKD